MKYNKLFTSMNSKNELLKNLALLDLNEEESKVYIELLGRPNTHLQIARSTGLNRTKVYRIVDQLEKRSLIHRRSDDRGTFLVADRPVALEMEQAVHEEKVRHRRAVIDRVVPLLSNIYNESNQPFSVHTYVGIEGFKQMQWHELRTERELLVFGNVTVEELVVDRRWSERLRALSAEKGYRTREIYNNPFDIPNFTKNKAFIELYEARMVPKSELPMGTPMVIYNDTVAIYQFKDDLRVGAEIINRAYAETMKSIFEHYWRLGKDIS